ncbi:AraC family transcriptional regulator [Pseudomonas sp. BN102]|nr:AraC family transcriptional regulator [Pseudomonas sp. BN102]
MSRLVRGMERFELDTGRLLERIGVDPGSLRQPSAQVCARKMDLLWQLAADAIPEVFLPVDLWRLHPRGIEHLAHGVHGSLTLREATSRLTCTIESLGIAPLYDLIDEGGQFHLKVTAPYPGFSPLRQVAALATCIEVWRRLGDCDLKLRQVHLALTEPADAAIAEQLRRYFGCEPRFDAGQSSLSLELADIDRPLLEWTVGATRLADTVRRQLADGLTSMEGMAMRLELSSRTLQRRLAEEGVSFSHLLGEVRCQLAVQYLREGRYTIKQIAYLLGFGDLSNFARTFRGWHGVSPSEYQRQQADSSDGARPDT